MKCYSYKALLFALSLVFILPACTGLEDGPEFSLRSNKKKLSNTWKVKEAVLNNEEITDRYLGGYITFENDGDFVMLDTQKPINLPPFTQDSLVTVAADGEWGFLSDKNHIEILYTYRFRDPYNVDVLYTEEAYEQWEITKLYENEAWLRSDSLNMSLKLELY